MSNVYDGSIGTYYYIIFLYNIQRYKYNIHYFCIVTTTPVLSVCASFNSGYGLEGYNTI